MVSRVSLVDSLTESRNCAPYPCSPDSISVHSLEGAEVRKTARTRQVNPVARPSTLCGHGPGLQWAAASSALTDSPISLQGARGGLVTILVAGRHAPPAQTFSNMLDQGYRQL
jgi:hypothetical protein